MPKGYMKEKRESLIVLDAWEEPLYEQQLSMGETNEQYEWFKIFCELSPSQRTARNVWKKFSGNENPQGRIPATVEWAYENLIWEQRAAAKDLSLIHEQEDSWVDRDKERRESDYALGEVLRQKAQEALEQLDFTNPNVISVTQLIKVLELASGLQDRAIPKHTLEKREIKQVLESLPIEKRERVMAILMAKAQEGA